MAGAASGLEQHEEHEEIEEIEEVEEHDEAPDGAIRDAVPATEPAAARSGGVATLPRRSRTRGKKEDGE
jgi:hypothetical protein